jgi:YggT family protein
VGAPVERDGAVLVVVQIILTLLQVLSWALIGRAILSWFDPQMNWPISRVLADATEPLIAPIRQIIPPIGGMIDISFIVAILLIQVLSRLLRQALLGY